MLLGELRSHVYYSSDFADNEYSWDFTITNSKHQSVYAEMNRDNNPVLLSLKNHIAGELKAVVNAINYATKNDLLPICIHYRYPGIKNWATGAWKTNHEAARKYQEYISAFKDAVRFVKA